MPDPGTTEQTDPQAPSDPRESPRGGVRLAPKRSLYWRALLFTLLGCGCLFGAILVQSWVMVNGTVDRLLQERISLAQSTGGYVEQLVERQLDQLSGAAANTLDEYAIDLRVVRKAIGSIYTSTVFQEGAFVLWPDGRPLASVPEEDLIEELDKAQLATLLAQARNSDLPVASSLTHLGLSQRPVLIFLRRIRNSTGRVLGYMGGLLHPASNNLLSPFAGSSGTRSMLQLVDGSGTVVSSTRPALLFQPTDHDSVLKRAIQDKREIKGRCHACHDERKGVPALRESEVLAFAPLRNLPFGMAVRQPERDALGPAFALQSRLIWLGVGFVVLFVGFTALSVHSVVSPITRLTRAVRRMDNTDSELRLPSFGNDELGELAQAFERWRNRVIESLGKLESRERALHEQFVETARHLKALQEVGNLGSQKKELGEFIQTALATVLQFFGLGDGFLSLTHGERKFQAKECKTHGDACLNEDLSSGLPVPSGATTPEKFQYSFVEPHPGTPALVARVQLGGISVSCTLLGAGVQMDPETFPLSRLESLLHQILVSSAHRLLHEKDAQKHKQSREFLQKVLRAQEEERRRIARELHDTLAQDLAAHRFEIERILNKPHTDVIGPDGESFDAKLKILENRAHEMLVTLRRLLLDLRPSVLDTMGFLPALQWYVERLERDHGIRGRVSAENEGLQLSPETEMSLFRIFQEALNNVVQHSQAQHVFVTINQEENVVEMVIEDDGRGFDPESLKKDDSEKPDPTKAHGAREPGKDGRGLGLLGIAERSDLLGGQMQIQSAPGEGTSITIRVPTEQTQAGTKIT